jgi:hypothetical protein
MPVTKSRDELDTFLAIWDRAHLRRGKRGQPLKPPEFKRRMVELNRIQAEESAYTRVVVPGTLTTCGCPVRYRVPSAHLDRRCFVCRRFRQVVDE